MDATAINASLAYARAISSAAEGRHKAAQPETGEAESGQSFGALVKAAASGAVDQSHAAEQASLQALSSKAALSDVVTAVSAAEVTLETVVAVRDRVIQAYQDIIKMPI